MKNSLVWTISAVIFMLGFPWLAATFAGKAGMAVCLILFFAVNPVFSAVCGVFSGRKLRQRWPLPFLAAGLFVAGGCLFLEMGEIAFLLYGGCYLVIGVVAMLISALVQNRKV